MNPPDDDEPTFTLCPNCHCVRDETAEGLCEECARAKAYDARADPPDRDDLEER